MREVALKMVTMAILARVEQRSSARFFVMRSGFPLWGKPNMFADLVLASGDGDEHTIVFEFKYIAVAHLAETNGRAGPHELNSNLLAQPQEDVMNRKLFHHSVKWNNHTVSQFLEAGRTQLRHYQERLLVLNQGNPVHAFLIWGIGLPKDGKAHFYHEEIACPNNERSTSNCPTNDHG
eukprot:TRINITY_DN2107_c0_g1_i2.p1 TRINITY_DN2107_c0_g1~~TRINITY_DN2107_c0_g1_i2.p1  ORF type:complete len:178 (-),score=12.39 TRINITY_DN2107_c0_g1_i2:109-642(-)